jgi:RNA-directed DNA polymerase
MLEQILDIRNLQNAWKQVIANKGSAGVDGMQTENLRDFLNTHLQTLRRDILDGKYNPQAVKKVEIPKPQGGTRMLGIPTVVDRLIQQSIAQWMGNLWDKDFSNFSYGFRPNKNAHQAVYQAQTFLNEGKEYVIELDLEKFFDKVNHDYLMHLLSKKITDKRLLVLIRKYLSTGMMEGGVVSQRIEGTPQGSPLSPLLSNILLDELDKELHKRGLSFVRYADDCSIYVKSKKSANRVMSSITKYIEQELKLKVNQTKSKVSRPIKSTLLGFSFYKTKGKWLIRVAKKSVDKMRDKIKLHLKRNSPSSLRLKVNELKSVIIGWTNYFIIAETESAFKRLDELARTRARICQWHQWKRVRTKIKNLIRLGITASKAYEWGNTSKGACRVAHSAILTRTLTNKYLTKLGLVSIYDHYFNIRKLQLKLF